MSFPSWTSTTRHDTYPAISPTNPALSSKGKVILITGGGSGIGAATAISFAKSGARAVIITGRTEKSLAASAAAIKALGLGCEARYFVADVEDAPRIEAIFSAVSVEFGKIDVVVSNAGYLPDHSLLKDARLEDWWRAFQVNTLGGFTVLQAFLRHASREGTFITIASALAHLYFPGFSSYGASKLAAVKLVQDAQGEWPERRFFSVQPGLIDTETSSKSNVPGEDTGEWLPFFWMCCGGIRWEMMGLIGGQTVDLPAGLSVWLASPEADFLKGRMLWANWDVEELKSKEEEIVDGDLLKIVLKGWP
jgi:NAD(P)-dependent dehydrogenase (short-subunit alcohol dehydrogenase family)